MTASLRRILVIDDVPDNVAVLFDFLRSHGFKVLVSESGRHALAELPQMAPDLILLDVMMPQMDGPTVLEKLRADPATAGIPVVFITARTQAQEVAALKALGALGVIAKPFDPMSLGQDTRAFLA